MGFMHTDTQGSIFLKDTARRTGPFYNNLPDFPLASCRELYSYKHVTELSAKQASHPVHPSPHGFERLYPDMDLEQEFFVARVWQASEVLADS